ncbi:34934_t:CDS:2, partial [Racocetra persica]
DIIPMRDKLFSIKKFLAYFLNELLSHETRKLGDKGSNGRIKVWQRVGKAYNTNCIRPTVKFGRRSVMFWCCFSWCGVGSPIEHLWGLDRQIQKRQLFSSSHNDLICAGCCYYNNKKLKAHDE